MWLIRRFLAFVRDAFVRAFAVIREHRTAYIVINAVFYGAIIATMIAGRVFPNLAVAAQAGTDTSVDPFNPLFLATYGAGSVPGAAAVTLGVNLLVGTVATLTIPSFVVPFGAVVLGLGRVVTWGFIFSPSGWDDMVWFVPHMIVAVIEAQGYILAAFAGWVQGRSWVTPKRIGLPTHRAGYRAGATSVLRLYPLIVLVLAAAALWEAFELIHLVPHSFLLWYLGETPTIP